MNRHSSHGRGHRRWFAVCLAVIVHGAAGAGCSYQAPDGRASDPGSSAQLPPWLSAGEASRRGPVRDFQEMMKAKYGHQQCGEDSDCPLGTHCDDETGVCDYECTGDDGCHSGQRCSDGGECVYGFTRFIASTDTSCASIPAATQLATLAHIAAHDNQGQISCFDDTWCPCGSFCDTAEMECAVECSALPGSTIACTDSTATCDPSGHCVTPSNPAPTPQLALVMSPASVSGDTFSTSVDVNVAVSVDALDVAFVVPTHPATVTYQVLGADTATGPEPLIKCTPSGTFASSCEIDGGWTFDTTSGSIHSATQTIVVRLPQTTVPQTWTLQASSEWAAVPTTLSADAAPVTPPPSVAGRYTGSLTVTSSVGPAISVPVDAVVTDTSIALVDRSTTVLPDGHADFSRDAAKVTMVRWLSSTVGGTTSGYNAAIKLGALIQDPKTGRITIGPGSLTLGAGAPSGVSLVLDRVGDLEPAACVTNSDCPVRDPNHPENDQYCDLVVGRCVLGDAPASGPGIVDATSSSATPSATLPSVAVAAWRPSVQALRQNNAALAGTGVDGVVRAYCARNPLDSAPPSFNADGVLSPAAQDAQCTPAGGGPDYPETMFPFAEQKQEFAPGVGGSSNFVLQDVCNTELNETPSSAIPGNKQCVSPARFFAALQANVDPATGTVAAGSDSHQYLVSQILRQWVGLQTYLVSTAAKSKDMHDLFEDDTLSAQARLAQAADLFEQELGVLLDPSVRPQFATGSIAARIAQQPDYRLLARATSRWNFNDSTIGDVNPTATVPDTEGNNGLVLTYSPSTNNGGMQGKNGYLSSWGYGGTRTCQTSGPIALDNNNWSFSAAVTVWTFRSASAVTLFDKVSSSGKRITLTAAPTNPDPNWPTLTPTILLQLKDSDGGSVDFTVPSWLPANFYSMSLIAVVSEQGTYRAYVSNPGNNPATIRINAQNIQNGGPRWNDAGTVSLGCRAPGADACTSFNQAFYYDNLGFNQTSSYATTSGAFSNWCGMVTGRWTCTGNPPGMWQTWCPSVAQSVQTSIVNEMNSEGARPDYVNGVSVAATGYTIQSVSNGTTRWTCNLAVTRSWGNWGYWPACGTHNDAVWTQWDEVAFWNHAITDGEFAQMVTRFANNVANETSPPKNAPAIPGNEQRAGLPVYLIESVNADLDLVSTYLAAEDDVVYSACYKGQASPERTVALARASRHLRLAAVLEGEAARLAAMADASAPWRPRYQAALGMLASRQDAVVQGMKHLFECTNSLGITDAEVPVYAGGSAQLNPADKFFAGTAYLIAKARDATDGTNGAIALESKAQTAFNTERATQFNVALATTQRNDRITALKTSAEDQLRKYCGTKPTDSSHPFPLLDGFANGTLTAANCFIKLEDPTCAQPSDPAARTLGAIKDSCLRGEIGERVESLKVAVTDQDNAKKAVDRATALYDAQSNYCTDTIAANADLLNRLLAAHQETMNSIHDRLDEVNLASGLLKGAINTAAAFFTGGTSKMFEKDGGATTGGSSLIDLGTQLFQKHYQDKLQDEDDNYAREVLAAQGDAAIAACKHAAEQMKPAIDAAMDASHKAVLEAQATLFGITDDMTSVQGVVAEVNAQIAVENSIDRAPPQLHYWLDQDISDYEKQMAYARRLTYLAVRSFEYEAQVVAGGANDFGYRARVLQARRPEDLDSVLHDIDALAGGTNFNANSLGLQIPNPPAVTLSLRDEIMNLQPAQGLDAAGTFAKMVSSDDSKIYVTGFDGKQHLLGHGVRFSIAPNTWWNSAFCDERSWRITVVPNVSGRTPSNTLTQPVILFQTNSFSSGTCRQVPGTITTTRVRQQVNLFTGDAPSAFTPADPYFNSPLTVPSVDKPGLMALPPDSSSLNGSFAGRGLYGDYILVFPTCDASNQCGSDSGYTAANLAKLTDVAIRIDFVAATNVPNNPN